MPSGNRRNPIERLLAWLGSHERGVLLSGAGLAAGIWIFAFIASEVVKGDSMAFDRSVLLSMRHADRKPIGTRAVQEAARDVTALGGDTLLALLTAFTSGLLLLSGRKRTGLFVLAAVIGGSLLSTLLKDLFQRPRPDLAPFGAYVSNSSFPSGHSMLSAVTYLTLGALLARSYERRTIKAFLLLSAAFVTLLVGVSRIYLGVHWPTDVLAGWTAGATWALLCWLAAGRLQLLHAIESETEQDRGRG